MLKVCKVEGCGKKHLAKGFCSSHYGAFRKYGIPKLKRPNVNRNPPGICTVEGCGKPHEAYGYCQAHYMHFKYERPARPGEPICHFEDCDRIVYAKGYCRLHYSRVRYKGTPELSAHKCATTGCNKNTYGKYCTKHKEQFEKGIPFDAPCGWAMIGERNPRWNGGRSEYINHAEFKRQRRIKLQTVGYTCERCGDVAQIVHHRNGQKTDHCQGNLQALCKHCHYQIHSGEIGKRSTSKFIRLYGGTLLEIATQLNVSTASVYNWDRHGILHDKLQSKGIEFIRKVLKNGAELIPA